MTENYLKPSEVILLRFYGSQTSRAFQDEADIYFDREYIYSPRVPKLYFKKNGQWQVLKETERPGILTIDTSLAGLEVVSLTARMREVPSKIYPMAPGMYVFSFSAPNNLPYVDAISVTGGSRINLKPEMVVLDTVAKVKATTSVTLEAVAYARNLEETEALYDVLAKELQEKLALVDTLQFSGVYPKLREPLSLNVAADDSVYLNYRKRYVAKREEAMMMWRTNKMGSASIVNRALRQKLDSLQALPLRVALVPSKIEPVYEDESCQESNSPQVEADSSLVAPDSAKVASVATTDSVKAGSAKVDSVVALDSLVARAMADSSVAAQAPAKSCKMKAIRFTFGKEGDRYNVAWSGIFKEYEADSLYALLVAGTPVRAFMAIENNKPVWIYDQSVLKGRHHYRYMKFALSVDNKTVHCRGKFELPNYILEQTEVQEWLNRPLEEPRHKLSEPVVLSNVLEDDGLPVIDTRAPRIVHDKLRGDVALLDSGVFRYKGKVVAMSGFAIQTTEVTQQRFKNVMDRLDSTKQIKDRSKFKGPNIPVQNITWNDAAAFCKEIGGDLPTEAQWEFAGRADNNEGAIWTLDEDQNPGLYAIYKSNSYSLGKSSSAYGPQPVKTKRANAWGIYDMSGNVAEWTRDRYFMFSVWVEKSNPSGALFGYSRIYKGGSWKDREEKLNLTEYDDEDPRYWSDWIGFRCAFPRKVIEGQ